MNALEMQLTPRQQQVYCLMVKGTTQCDMAKELGISVRTIKFHRACIFKALDVRSTREVVANHYRSFNGSNEKVAPGVELLSKAERIVYDKVILGLSRKEISNLIFRTEETVRLHVRNIGAKLGAGSMLEILINHYTNDESNNEMRKAA